MIEKFQIRNYKCFPELSLSMKRMNILAGANATGKSSVIQSILLAFAAMRETGKYIKIGEALKIQTGNPSALIAQNAIELEDGDFEFEIFENDTLIKIKYYCNLDSPLDLAFQKNEESMKSQIFYLNAERKGPRISYPAGGDLIIESDGSNAAYLVEMADMSGVEVSKEIQSNPFTGKFSAQVEEWMNIILGDVKLTVSTDMTKASTDIHYMNSLVDYGVLPTMTGFGISYVFSIITAALLCSTKQNAVLIVENPEAHLHPAAQSRMGKFLQMISTLGVQVIIETHSEHIIDGARVQAADSGDTNDMQVLFFYVKDEDIGITQISLNKSGELSEWPKGFFDQKSQDLRDLLMIRRRNAGKE